MINNNNNNINRSDTKLKDLLVKYLVYWKWIALSLIICVSIAYVKLRYIQNVYNVYAKVLVKDDEKKDGVLSELSKMQDNGEETRPSVLNNTIEIFKSRSLMRRVAEDLKLNVEYFTVKRTNDFELYPDVPITINFLNGNASIYDVGACLYFKMLSSSKFSMSNDPKTFTSEYNFGEKIKSPIGTIVITPVTPKIDEIIKVVITPIDVVADRYSSCIVVDIVGKQTSLLRIALDHKSIIKAKTVITKLIDKRNEEAVADKNLVWKNTYDFLGERIALITNELSKVENAEVDFKKKNKLIDIETEGESFRETETSNQKEILELNTQMRLVDFMIEYLNAHSKMTDILPSNIGITDPTIGQTVGVYNTLVLEHNRIIKSTSIKNPIVINLEVQIANLHKNLQENLNNTKAVLGLKENELQNQSVKISSKIASVPKSVNEFRSIERQHQIKESLYLYLLEKREETSINLAATVPDIQVIDSAYSNGGAIYPNRQNFYLIGVVLGLMIPALIIFVINMFDTKVHSMEDIQSMNLPYLGDIPLSNEKSNKVISKGDNSNIAEAFRHLRTNIEFTVGNTPSRAKTIFVTSTISKEGKSFVSTNLARSFALTGEKTLLIGLDLRVPKILEYLELQTKKEYKGVSQFLVDPSITVDELIVKGAIENLDIIHSGLIPPNPAELLRNGRIDELFVNLKDKYDVIIVDTAPVIMVTDTLLVSHLADSFVYVVKADYLDKRLLHVPEQMYVDKRLPNMALLLNGSDTKIGYGYGYRYRYQYRYEKQVNPWWKTLLNIS